MARKSFLKPVFGALVDRVGPRPVLLGGLVGFAGASAAFVIAGDPGLLGVARFGQGAQPPLRSPPRRLPWSPGSRRPEAMVDGSAATAHGRVSGTRWARWKAVRWSH